jgi:hypothetical protein
MSDFFSFLSIFSRKTILQWLNRYFLFFTHPVKFWKETFSQNDEESFSQLIFFSIIVSIFFLVFSLTNVDTFSVLKNILIDLFLSLIYIYPVLLVTGILFSKYRTAAISIYKRVLLFILFTKIFTYPILFILIDLFSKYEEFNFFLIYNIFVCVLFIYNWIFSSFFFYKRALIRIFASVLNILLINVVQLLFWGALINSTYGKRVSILDNLDPIQDEYFSNRSKILNLKSFPIGGLSLRDIRTHKKIFVFSYSLIKSFRGLDCNKLNHNIDFINYHKIDSLYLDTLNRNIDTLNKLIKNQRFHFNETALKAELRLYENTKSLLNNPLDSINKNIFWNSTQVLIETLNNSKFVDTINEYNLCNESVRYLNDYLSTKESYESKFKKAFTPFEYIRFLNFFTYFLPPNENNLLE